MFCPRRSTHLGTAVGSGRHDLCECLRNVHKLHLAYAAVFSAVSPLWAEGERVDSPDAYGRIRAKRAQLQAPLVAICKAPAREPLEHGQRGVDRKEDAAARRNGWVLHAGHVRERVGDGQPVGRLHHLSPDLDGVCGRVGRKLGAHVDHRVLVDLISIQSVDGHPVLFPVSRR